MKWLSANTCGYMILILAGAMIGGAKKAFSECNATQETLSTFNKPSYGIDLP